jgi:hypothetical protein
VKQPYVFVAAHKYLFKKMLDDHVFSLKTDMDAATDKKENQIFLIHKEIQSGAVAKS